MDDFGVLVQTYGIRPQGKSAPMAASKAATRAHNYDSANLDPRPSSNSKSTHNSSSGNGSLFDDQNDVFGFGFSHKPQNYASVDVFQMPANNSNGAGEGGLDFDIEAVFKSSMNLNTKASDANDDLIWGFSGGVSSNGAVDGGDLLSSDPVHDFLGNLGNMGSGSSSRSDDNTRSNIASDDLIPGFGSSSSRDDRAQGSSTKKSSDLSSAEQLEDFGMMKKKANGTNAFKVKIEPIKTYKPKSAETNLIDVDLDGSFDGSSTYQEYAESASRNMFEAEATDLDSFFKAHSQKSKSVLEETNMNRKTDKIPDLSSGMSFSMEKKISPGNSHDDFSLFFGVAPTSTQFEEIEGESEERRRARLDHYQTTQARMAQALADLNEREFRAQQEQEERHRIAEPMDRKMKQWAAGKEGKLRALLSSLDQILAPEVGWKPVSLTDLITSSQVKIAYKKAALCVHPDKVQQKGANLEQKYVAEKVFDLLKEAWNKFNSEELR